VITGTGRQRRFSDDDKARIIEETLAPGAVVSEVARRYGLSPQQLFGWRRQARLPAATSTDAEARRFVVEAEARFLGDGRIEIDSNVVERSIRPIALNRVRPSQRDKGA
jgi:transposase-like protein